MTAKRHPQLWQKFLKGETDLGYFVRGHLAVHNHIATLIAVQLGETGKELLEHAAFNLIQTYEIAVAIGALDGNLRPVIRRINAVRNALAHKIGLELDAVTARSIFDEAPASLKERVDPLSRSPKELVSLVFEFLLFLTDKLIANTIARRERTRRSIQDADPEVSAAFESWWKSERDPKDPELLALEERVFEAMSNMPFPLPRRLDFPEEEDAD